MSARGHRRRNAGASPMRPGRERAKPTVGLHPRSNPYHAIEFWQGRLERPRFVYFIQHENDGPVKIGEAFDPKARLGELQCGNPFALNLRAVVVATDTTEHSLHLAWQRAWIRGEWFGGDDTTDILAMALEVQSLQAQLGEVNATGYGIGAIASQKIRPREPGWRAA